MEDARQDVPGNHRSILRGARRLHGRAAPDQQSYHSDEQCQQNHANAGILTPTNLLVQDQTKAACSHISQNGGVAHVALKTEQAVGEVGGQYLGDDGADKRAHLGGSHSLHSFKRSHVHRLDLFIENLADVGEGKDGDGCGARQSTQAENVGGDQGGDQGRQGADDTQEQPHSCHDHPVVNDIGRGQHGEGHHQDGANEGTQQGHLDGVEQGLPNLGHIVPLRRDHVAQNDKKLLNPTDQDPHVKTGDLHRKNRHGYQNHCCQRSTRSGFGNLLSVG